MKNFKYYNHLGFHNPYYIKNHQLNIKSEFSDLVKDLNHKTLDFAAVVQILCTGYSFGERTLIKEIKKSPWMAKPNDINTDWDFFIVPKHQEKSHNPSDIVKTFYELLEEEIYDYVVDSHHIGILLTGGMDSRIVAAVLNNLIIQGKLKNKTVTAYTWGFEDSRDVVYAKRISDLFKWNWKHVVVDDVQLRENCSLLIKSGCEFTPIHLHAISKVAEEKALDCVLAGSFGDSIGRAEYSGVKVKNLQSIEKRIKNVSNLLRIDFYELVEKDIKFDINFYHEKFKQDFDYQQYEMDLQIHYMRRMLNPCMNVINKNIPLHQIFSSPKVFGYMWSLKPELRTDEIYYNLLKNYSPKLLDIPWARTGIPYLAKEGSPDNYKKRHHDYGKMIRNSFLDDIELTIKCNTEIVDKLFNREILLDLTNNVRKYPMNNSFGIEEKLLWVACLINFIKINGVNIDLPNNVSINKISALKQNALYKLKYFYKILKK